MKQYTPSNGSEAERFRIDHCYLCAHHDPDDNRATKTCSLLGVAHWEGTCNAWVYDANNKPTCTEHKYKDWNQQQSPPEPVAANQYDIFGKLPEQE